VGEHYGIPSESLFTGLVVYENDVRAYIQSKGPDRDMGTGVRIEGTRGLIEVGWNGQTGQAVLYDDPSWRPPDLATDEDKSHVMKDVYRDTLDRLEDGQEPLLSYKKAVRAAEIIFALYESARRRERIELPLEAPDAGLASLVEEVRASGRAAAGGRRAVASD
jgi:predicted dehydrogenase